MEKAQVEIGVEERVVFSWVNMGWGGTQEGAFQGGEEHKQRLGSEESNPEWIWGTATSPTGIMDCGSGHSGQLISFQKEPDSWNAPLAPSSH